MQYLVINNNKNAICSFADQYQLFNDREEAIKQFVKIGGDANAWGMGLSDTPGTASVQKGGDIDVMFLPTNAK